MQIRSAFLSYPQVQMTMLWY